MALVGRYGDTSGRPYYEGIIFIPSLKIHGQVSWLVDTGADNTVLAPTDALKMGVDYSKLTTTEVSLGVGGASTDFIEAATFLAVDFGVAIYQYQIKLTVTKPR